MLSVTCRDADIHAARIQRKFDNINFDEAGLKGKGVNLLGKFSSGVGFTAVK